jgi:phenylacetate-CoA ligase
MKVFDRKNEGMRTEEMAQFQLERVQALVARLRRNVRRYRETLGDRPVKSLSDLALLPVTTPENLAAAFPYGMFALPLREVFQLQSTVGPDGRPLVIGHTRNDLSHWGRLVARQLAAAGVTPHDLIQICLEQGTFKGATGYRLGAELIEACVVPEDPAHIDYQLAMLQNYRVTVLITTPTNAHELVDLTRRRGIDPQSLALRAVLLSRPVPPAEREAIKSGLFADVHCSFGIDEVLNPGLCVECSERNLHVNEDHFLVEEQGGELLLTTLCREAMPLLRYATREGVNLRREKCACGRTGVILVPTHRLDGRLRVNEMPLYPSQVAGVLGQTRAAGQPFSLQLSERGAVVTIEMTEKLFTDTMRNLVDIQQEVAAEFRARLGIQAEVTFVSPKRTDAHARS